ncbi:unnamed protein product [Rotaria socialis]|uniref:PDZ domain-containing protein n=1 Tax=Rotaria socialis TaxID=392032 RepID=A0A818JFW5_9BILA|nr:unnamed protein product [Rotaria socialis]CAF4386416.1 unnamed protein product [Rotaria socialis]
MSNTPQIKYKEHWKKVEIDLHRQNKQEGWGFHISGGIDKYNFPLEAISVSKIDQNGLAQRDQRLKSNDIILKANKINFTNIKQKKALKILRKSGPSVGLLICRLEPRIIEDIQLVHSGKLGITIVGGIGDEYFPTDHGIFIVDKDKTQLQTNQQLHLGDRLLNISSGDNIRDLRFVMHAEAKQIIESACKQSNRITLRVGRARYVETPITPPVVQPNSPLRTAYMDKLATYQGQQGTEAVFNGNRRPRLQLD